MMEDKPILFGPINGKSLLREYPELNNEREFKDLSAEDLHFCWLIGIRSSPVDQNMPDEIRFRTAASIAFKNNEEKKKRFGDMNVEGKIKEAIDRFKRYSPEARNMAQEIVQKIFHNYQRLVDVDTDSDFKYQDKEGNDQIDFTARKQYVDSCKTIAEALPVLIKQMEDGFGVKAKKGDDSSSINKAIDKFHAFKKDRV